LNKILVYEEKAKVNKKIYMVLGVENVQSYLLSTAISPIHP